MKTDRDLDPRILKRVLEAEVEESKQKLAAIEAVQDLQLVAGDVMMSGTWLTPEQRSLVTEGLNLLYITTVHSLAPIRELIGDCERALQDPLSSACPS